MGAVSQPSANGPTGGPSVRHPGRFRGRPAWFVRVMGCLVAGFSCAPSHPTATEPPEITRGRDLFFNETFGGNGRTCGTCHRAEDNFGLTPAFVATLPPDDPLFVAETNPDLGANFENPRLMRAFALIMENLDGFDDLANVFTMRGVPHTLALRTSVASRLGPQTGWSGDGAPGDGSLRSFSTGAVIQHFTLTTNRVADVDFRLPTDQELDDLEAFMLSLGRQEEVELPLPLHGVVAVRGQEIFLDNALGKCNACHFNAGANANPALLGPGAGNLNFNTGVEALPDQPGRLTGEPIPVDDGNGRPGIGEFNTPPLIEAADTGPFFHNNAVETIEGAVAFYNGAAFNDSPAGVLIRNATGGGIVLDATQVVAVAAFLRVLNALENIRGTLVRLHHADSSLRTAENLRLAVEETDDAILVLQGGGLHPEAVAHLRASRAAIIRANGRHAHDDLIEAIRAQERAREELVESQ